MFDFPKEVNIVFDTLLKNGYEGYLVGGCIRDILMGEKPKDYDFAVSCTPEQTEEAFCGYRVIETGLKHGTVTVKINKFLFELTTFRTEGEYIDFRRPASVKYTSSLAEDLKRRDFTVNALAYSPKSGITDLFGGSEDIKRKLIKCVGKPEERFTEDALRIMRALRFASVLGFSIDAATAEAIHSHKQLLSHISVERIYQELNGLICGNPDFVLREFEDVFSLILGDYNREAYLDSAPKDRLIRLSLLLKDTAPLKRLKADGATIRAIRELHSFKEARFSGEAELLYTLGRLKYTSPALAAGYIGCLRECKEYVGLINSAVSKIESSCCVSLKQLEINGSDLINAGFPAGSRISELLDGLLKEVISLKIPNEKNALLKRARDMGDKNESI